MTGLKDTLNAGKKEVIVTLLIAAVTVALACFLFCGSAVAAPALEARVGDLDGARVALTADTVTPNHLLAGGMLELGEDYTALLGRVGRVWHGGKVVWYVAADAGLAFEAVETTGGEFHSKGPRERVYTVTQQTETDSAFTAGVAAGVRGLFQPGIGWALEVQCRDAEVADGCGGYFGFRFR